jgi:glutathione S-transferase
MYDSPYVRRVAISLQVLGIAFEHRSISLFRQVDAFAGINPLLKAPTLVCDDGLVLVDSGLILDAIEMSAGRRLLPSEPNAHRRALRAIGLALVAAEKSVQVVYERRMRPEERQHVPWLERISGQLAVAFELLEAEFAVQAPQVSPLDQVGITSAVSWRFAREYLPEQLDWQRFPLLTAWSLTAEALPAFQAVPFEG